MSANPVTAWIVPLKGHLFDLEDLPHHTEGSPVSVINRGEGWYLRIPSDVVGHDFEPVLPVARNYVALLNGICAVELHDVRPLELASGEYYALDAYGQVVHTVVQMSTPGVRYKAGHAGQHATAHGKKPNGAFAPLLREANSVPPKADALAIVGRSTLNWSELYLAFALVEAGVGKRMYSQRWISRLDAELFMRTVRTYTALGGRGSSRKAVEEPPASLMTLTTALHLIRRLVARWVADTTSPET
jgi:hypothetical protein